MANHTITLTPHLHALLLATVATAIDHAVAKHDEAFTVAAADLHAAEERDLRTIRAMLVLS